MVNLANIGKFLVALAGAAGIIISNGLVPQQYLKYVTGPIAAVSALGVYFIRNGPTAQQRINKAANDAVSQYSNELGKGLVTDTGRENVT